MKIHLSVMTNSPYKAAKTLWFLSSKKGVSPFVLSVFIHEQQEQEMKEALRARNLGDVLIITHTIEGRKNFTPFGKLRYFHMQELQTMMGSQDGALILDDDLLNRPMYGTSKILPCGSYRFLVFPLQAIYKEAERLVNEARDAGFRYFTVALKTQARGGYTPKKKFRAQWNYAGSFGFFKTSYNPFDKSFGGDADWDAAANLMHKFQTLPILLDKGLLFRFDFEAKAYKNKLSSKGLQRDRAIAKIKKRWPHLLHFDRTVKSGVSTPQIIRKISIMFQQAVRKEYR